MHAIVCALVASLSAGCSLIGTGRVSLGVTATTQGAVGLAVAGELGGGVLYVPDRSASGHGIGYTEGFYLGAGAMPDGWQYETGGHGELVMLDGDGELRAGFRAGIVGNRARGFALAPDLAVCLARARWWDPGQPRLGLELRAGPLIGVEGGASLEALRGYVGVSYQAHATSRSFDPIQALFRGWETGKH